MRNVRIKSFKDSQDRIYTLDNTSGFYVNGTIQKGIMDIVGVDGFRIHSVTRLPSRTTHQGISSVFTLNDRIGANESIANIKIVQNKVVLVAGGDVPVEEAVRYVAPVVDRTIYQSRNTAHISTNTFREIETAISISHPRPIRLERTLKRRRETLQEFLIKFFEEWNDDKNTVYVDTNEVQTMIGKRRSLGDIYMICKYYYPNCTVSEVIKLLYVTLPTIFEEGFRSCKCLEINKRVWKYVDGEDNNMRDPRTNDEYGHNPTWYINQFN